jgi:hypothetical protein
METDTLTMFYPEEHRDTNKWLRPALMTSDSVEWYTPPHIRDAVVRALGGRVDLDPCADPGKTFPAAEHFTPVENGLARRWIGRVYMNPPYGREIVSWTTKLRDELAAGWVTEAIALLPARVDTGWWHSLRPEHLCLIRGRLQFSGYECSAPFPSVAAYFGSEPDRFRAAFWGLGLFYAAL